MFYDDQWFDKDYFDGDDKGGNRMVATGHHFELGKRLWELFPDSRIVDVGTGIGHLVEQLRNRGVDAWGCDVSTFAVEQTASPGYVRRASVFDLTPMKDLLPADVVVCWSVLDYFEGNDVKRVLNSLKEAIGSNGLLVLAISTTADFKENPHGLIGRPDPRPKYQWKSDIKRAGLVSEQAIEEQMPAWGCFVVRKARKPGRSKRDAE